MVKVKPVSELLVEDEASRYRARLSSEQRRPKLDENKLGESGESFSEEEIEAAFDVFCPR